MIRNIIKVISVLFFIALTSKIIFLTYSSSTQISLLSIDGIFSVIYGLRFDATAAIALAAPIILLILIFNFTRFDIRPLLKTLLSIAALWLIIATTSDTIYAEEARKHITYELLTASGSEIELAITAFIVYYPIIIIGVIQSLIAVYLIVKLPLTNTSTNHSRILPFCATILVWLLTSVTIIRGGWMDAPQSPMSTYKIGNNDKAYIAWSAPYAITYYLARGKSKAAAQVTPPAREALYKDLQQALSTTSQPSLSNLKRANIVFVLLESWVSIDMKSYGSTVDATPFFDTLRANSLSSRAMYADGYRTVQGMFASLCSSPNPIGGVVSGTQLQNNTYSCLPQILNDLGWDTRFVQGSGKGIVGTFAQSLGYEESYGKEDYGFESEMNYWGYLDHGIYQFSLDKIKEMQNDDSKKPFFITINTGTTHGISLPEEDDYAFGKDTPENLRRSILNYADKELEAFITDLNSTLTEPTLVVLMSDHTAKITEPGLAKNSVPFLIYATDNSVPVNNLDTATSQRDIAPTVIDWLGGDVPWFTGQSLLDSDAKFRSSFTDGHTFFWVDNQNMLAIDSSNGALQHCYTIQNDTISVDNLDCQQEWVPLLHQQGRDFSELTQDLLFKGETMKYRNIGSLLSPDNVLSNNNG